MQKKYEIELDGKKLSFEFGKFARFANTSVLIRYGGTAVLTTITASKEANEELDFFPLSVDYEEKLYSVGKIPGGFQKREGRPTEIATLIGRAIDRPMRPLFPSDLRNQVQISALLLSVDEDFSPEFAAMIGANIGVHVSDVPFNGPIATVNVGLMEDNYVLNPTEEMKEKSELYLTVAGSKDKIVMIEAGANEVSNQVMMDAIKFGHKYIKELCEFQEKVRQEIGLEKFEYKINEIDTEIMKIARKECAGDIRKLLDTYPSKEKLDEGIAEAREKLKEVLSNKIDELTEKLWEMQEKQGENYDWENDDEKLQANCIKYMDKAGDVINALEKDIIRQNIIEKKQRVDGRKLEEVRKLAGEVALFERTHGSGLFERGETQVLSLTTLGKLSEVQRLDGVDPQEEKRYMHQYNFPGYSVGEARGSRGPGRREIGHGALAEKSLIPVLPDRENFPYAIRVVSEVLGSNGSTSQAAICGSTLSLMDAGVPIKAPVAGISAGLFVHNPEDGNYDDYTMITDIQGVEDFFGDMDFKVGGTKKGITAIQVDIKIDGLTYAIIEEAFEKTEKARIDIIDNVILDTISKPREELSPYAPKITKLMIPIEKIGMLIGAAGKNINKIIEETGVEIDIEDDGLVLIYGEDTETTKKALEMIELSIKEYEVGEIVTGTVIRIVKFGAFIELPNGQEGLLHISKISNKRVNNVEDELEEGQEITVKVDEIDKEGKIDLNRKDVFNK